MKMINISDYAIKLLLREILKEMSYGQKKQIIANILAVSGREKTDGDYFAKSVEDEVIEFVEGTI